MKIKKTIKLIYGFSIAIAALLIFQPLFAATIALRALTTQVSSGSSFTVSVDVNTQGAAINNAEAVINFPPDLVEVTSLNTSGSIFSLWVEPAAFSNSDGTVTFNGGIPNPGYNGSGGHILSIQFKSKAAGTAQIAFASASVRANDGLGTEVLSGKNGASISITQKAAPTPSPVSPNPTPVPTSLNNTQNTSAVITSVEYPDSSKWYNTSSGSFDWSLPQGTVASQTSLDKTQGTTPRILRKPPASSITIDNIADGIWYFNARFLSSGSWSKVSSYKIQVDTTPPDSLVINTSGQNQYPIISAHDELSGIDYFIVQIDGSDAIKLASTGGQTPIKIPGISAGNHLVKVTAYDLAGNSTASSANVEFKQSTEALIRNYSQTINEGQRITVVGTGSKNSTVVINLQTEDGITRTYSVATSDTGEFSFQSEPIAGTGNYELWAQTQIANGNLGTATSHVKIIVNPSSLSKLGNAIKSLLTASNIIILILSILCILGWMNYFLLKKSLKRGAIKKTSKKETIQD